MKGKAFDAFGWGVRVWALALSPLILPGVCGRSVKSTTIDQLCIAIRQEFLEASPRHFSGPAPWVELERLPSFFGGDVLATVYNEGSRVRWVVLEMASPNDLWFETTDYFFDERGFVQKRERRLAQQASNVWIEESIYFRKGKILKTTYHHSPLNGEEGGEEDWDRFYDPNAPEYTSTGDLPVLFRDTDFRQLGQMKHGFGLCTRCTGSVTEERQSLLKFSLPSNLQTKKPS
jgi:hypothetical protein